MGRLISMKGSKLIEILLHLGQVSVDLNWPVNRLLIKDRLRLL